MTATCEVVLSPRPRQNQTADHSPKTRGSVNHPEVLRRPLFSPGSRPKVPVCRRGGSRVLAAASLGRRSQAKLWSGRSRADQAPQVSWMGQCRVPRHRYTALPPSATAPTMRSGHDSRNDRGASAGVDALFQLNAASPDSTSRAPPSKSVGRASHLVDLARRSWLQHARSRPSPSGGNPAGRGCACNVLARRGSVKRRPSRDVGIRAPSPRPDMSLQPRDDS